MMMLAEAPAGTIRDGFGMHEKQKEKRICGNARSECYMHALCFSGFVVFSVC